MDGGFIGDNVHESDLVRDQAEWFAAGRRISMAKDLVTKICKKCKTPNRPTARFCHGCGTELT